MIAGLDSSFDRPTPAQAAAAHAAGVRVWGGYIGTRGGLGLATLWSRADFDVVRAAGMTPIGFCSGWDDPVGVRDLARAWGVLLCVDVESGIRNDGPWVQGWLDASGAGLYGLGSVHAGRSAAFHIVAWYGFTPPACSDPQRTWPSWLPQPAGPLAWQFCGTHDEFGLSVDRGWYDDWFSGGTQDMPLDPNDPVVQQMMGYFDGIVKRVDLDVAPTLHNVLARVGSPATVDVAALAAALTPLLPKGTDPQAVANAVLATLKAKL